MVSTRGQAGRKPQAAEPKDSAKSRKTPATQRAVVEELKVDELATEAPVVTSKSVSKGRATRTTKASGAKTSKAEAPQVEQEDATELEPESQAPAPKSRATRGTKASSTKQPESAKAPAKKSKVEQTSEVVEDTTKANEIAAPAAEPEAPAPKRRKTKAKAVEEEKPAKAESKPAPKGRGRAKAAKVAKAEEPVVEEVENEAELEDATEVETPATRIRSTRGAKAPAIRATKASAAKAAEAKAKPIAKTAKAAPKKITPAPKATTGRKRKAKELEPVEEDVELDKIEEAIEPAAEPESAQTEEVEEPRTQTRSTRKSKRRHTEEVEHAEIPSTSQNAPEPSATSDALGSDTNTIDQNETITESFDTVMEDATPEETERASSPEPTLLFADVDSPLPERTKISNTPRRKDAQSEIEESPGQTLLFADAETPLLDRVQVLQSNGIPTPNETPETEEFAEDDILRSEASTAILQDLPMIDAVEVTQLVEDRTLEVEQNVDIEPSVQAFQDVVAGTLDETVCFDTLEATESVEEVVETVEEVDEDVTITELAEQLPVEATTSRSPVISAAPIDEAQLLSVASEACKEATRKRSSRRVSEVAASTRSSTTKQADRRRSMFPKLTARNVTKELIHDAAITTGIPEDEAQGPTEEIVQDMVEESRDDPKAMARLIASMSPVKMAAIEEAQLLAGTTSRLDDSPIKFSTTKRRVSASPVKKSSSGRGNRRRSMFPAIALDGSMIVPAEVSSIAEEAAEEETIAAAESPRALPPRSASPRKLRAWSPIKKSAKSLRRVSFMPVADGTSLKPSPKRRQSMFPAAASGRVIEEVAEESEMVDEEVENEDPVALELAANILHEQTGEEAFDDMESTMLANEPDSTDAATPKPASLVYVDDAETPAYAPSMFATPSTASEPAEEASKPLVGTTWYVSVYDHGACVNDLWIPGLEALGATVNQDWHVDLSTTVTHVLFNNGSMRTLQRSHDADVKVVKITYVLDVERFAERLDETDAKYAIDVLKHLESSPASPTPAPVSASRPAEVPSAIAPVILAPPTEATPRRSTRISPNKENLMPVFMSPTKTPGRTPKTAKKNLRGPLAPSTCPPKQLMQNMFEFPAKGKTPAKIGAKRRLSFDGGATKRMRGLGALRED